MKAVVNDKKHLTLVSHTNGVVIVEESGCIIDLDFQLLASICEIADLGNICTIKDCDEIESLKDVLDKYENDIVDFNVSAMDIYYIHKASPNVVRKFNYDNFNITCKDQLTANSINTLLNCSNSSVDDIVETFKNEIAYSNIH